VYLIPPILLALNPASLDHTCSRVGTGRQKDKILFRRASRQLEKAYYIRGKNNLLEKVMQQRPFFVYSVISTVQRFHYPFLSLSFLLLPVPSYAFPSLIISSPSCSLIELLLILSFLKGEERIRRERVF